MRRRVFLCGALAVLAAPLGARAQQAAKVYRIGMLWSAPRPAPSQPTPTLDAFRQGMRDLGLIEGLNWVSEARWTPEYERLPALATELLRLKVDLVLTGGTPAALAAKNATREIPIVMVYASDPVGAGLVASLARPGSNVTGLSSFSQDLGGKRLELLKEAIPKVSRVAVLYDRNDPAKIAELNAIEIAARSLGVQLQSLAVGRPDDFDKAFQAATQGKAAAVLVLPTTVLNAHQQRIAELASINHLPTMFARSELMEAGGLMAYGPHYPDFYRRAATYVDKILRGAKPSDLPVEQPTKFELVINMKTAKALGLTIPQSVLLRADQVIE